jgi:hypothetical protein
MRFAGLMCFFFSFVALTGELWVASGACTFLGLALILSAKLV